MKKTVLVATITTSAFLLGGCTLPFLPKSDTAESTEAPASEASMVEDAAAQIAAAMKSGQSLRCTASMADGSAQYEYFFQGNKFRMDGTVTTEGKTEKYHAINDTTFMYTWSDAQKTGVKFKVPTEAELGEQEEKYKQYMDNVPDFSKETAVREFEEQGYTMNCRPAGVDAAVFTPDSTVEFQDMSMMMQQTMQQTQQQAMPSLNPEQQEQLQNMMQKMGQ